MTSIEELLLQDIEAVSAGTVLTEQDLRDARDELDRRVDVRRHQDRRRAVALVAAAATVVVGVASWQVTRDDKDESPVGPITDTTDSEQAFLAGDVPTEEQLLGIWHAHDPAKRDVLWKFTADGLIGLNFPGNIAETPAVVGTFDIVDDAIVIEINDNVSMCEDKSWTLRAAVNEEGGLNILPLDVDVANVCGMSVLSRWVLDQVLPVPEGADLPEVPSGDRGDPPPQRAYLLATWYDPAGGYIMELRDDGTYTMLTGPAEQADRGTWTLGDERTRLTLVSATDSAICNEGDELVLNNLGYRELDVSVLQGDVERNDCRVPFEGTGWFRLGPES